MEHDRAFLFAVLAVQLRLATPAQLMQAGAQWTAQPDRDFADVLVESGVLTAAEAARVHARLELLAAGAEAPGTNAAASSDEPVANTAPKSQGAMDTVPCQAPPSFDALLDFQDVVEIPGRYVDVDAFARGGFGRLWRVYDRHLCREIALKELAARQDDPKRQTPFPQLASRFLREARITSQLDHPSIVPVYELGRRQDGKLYYTMKLVRGKTLATAIQEAKSLEGRLALLPHFVDLCQAVAYAHSRGIIHRDIKPLNIMIGDFGETVVIDWGLATPKRSRNAEPPVSGTTDTVHTVRLETDSGREHTRYGEAIGTPAYMPPEQALGQLERIDERSDVYSLGVVLFELLTARQPFEGDSAEEVVRRLLREQPPEIAALQEGVPPELRAICQRALAKDSANRYPDAKALADDIVRFQSGALVTAHEYRFRDYVGHFTRQHWPKLSAAAAVLGIVAGITAYSYWAVVQQRNVAIVSERKARQAELEAEHANADLHEALGSEEQARTVAEAAQRDAEAAQAAAQRDLYFSLISLANQHIANGSYEEARTALAKTPVAYRDWEWGWLEALCHGDWQTHRLPRDGSEGQAAIASCDGAARVWALRHESGAVSVLDAMTGFRQSGDRTQFRRKNVGMSDLHALTPDGTRLVLTYDDRLYFYALPDGAPIANVHANPVAPWLGFSGDSSRVFAGMTLASASILSLNDASVVTTIHGDFMLRGYLSEHGDAAVACFGAGLVQPTDEGTAALFDVATGEKRFEAAVSNMTLVAIIENPLRVILSTAPQTLVLLDGRDGSVLRTFTCGPGHVTALTAPAHGTMLVAGTSAGAVHVFDLDSGASIFNEQLHTGAVNAVAVLPEEGVVASGGEDHVVAAVHPGTPVWRRMFRGHSGQIVTLAVDDENDLIWSCDQASLKSWSLQAPGYELRVASGMGAGVVMPEQNALLAVQPSGEIARMNLRNGHAWLSPMALPPEGNPLVSPRGRWILVRNTNAIDLCDTVAQITVTLSEGVDYKRTAATFSPDESRLAVLVPDTSGKSLSLDVYDLAGERPALAGKEKLFFDMDTTSATGALAFTARGGLLVLLNGSLVACDPQTGRLLHATPLSETSGGAGAMLAITNAAGDRLAIATADNTVSIVSLDGARQALLSGHQSPVSAMAFSQSGNRIITGATDGSISIWDCQTGREVLPMESLHSPVRLLAFNGGSLIAAGETETAILTSLIPDTAPLPGTEDAPLSGRIARYRFGSAFVAPEWGRCQHMLAQASLSAAVPDQVDVATGAGCPAGGAFTLEPERLTYRCSLHGGLNNRTFLESLAEAVETESAQVGEAGPFHDMLRRVSNSLSHEMPQLATTWVEEGRLLHTALFAAGTFSERGHAQFAPAEVRAALALGQLDRAVNVADHLKEPALLGLSAYAHALRGTPEDVRIAYEHIRSALKANQQNDDVLKAYGELTRGDKGQGLALAQQVDALMHPQREAWRDLPWHKDRETALQRAAETTKPVLVFFSNPDAYYAEYMKKETFGLLAIQDELREKFELLYIEAPAPGPDAPPALEHGPGIEVLDAEGNLLFRRAGYVNTDDFRENVLSAAGEPGIIRALAIAGPFTPDESGSLLPAEQALHDGATMPLEENDNWTVCHADLRGRFRLDAYDADLADGDYLCSARILCNAPTTATLRYALSHPARIWVNAKVVETDEPTSSSRARIKVALPQGETTILVRLRGVSQTAQVKLALDPPSLASARLAPFDPALPRRASLATNDPEPLPADTEVSGARIAVNKDDVLKEWRQTWDTYAWGLIGLVQLEFPKSPGGGYRGIKCNNVSPLKIGRMLDLRDGDIVLSINGMALNPGEAYLNYLARIQEMTQQALPEWIVELERNGARRRVIYEVQH